MLRCVSLYSQRFGNLLYVAAFVVPQNEGGTLHVAQLIEGGFEKLGYLRALRKPLRPWLRCGYGLEPILRLLAAVIDFDFLSAPSRTQQIQGAIGAYSVEPGRECGAVIEFADLSVSAKKGLLDQILRVLFITTHTVSQAEDGPAVALNQDTKSKVSTFPHLVGGHLIGPLHSAGL
jgi:hypothetical protein